MYKKNTHTHLLIRGASRSEKSLQKKKGQRNTQQGGGNAAKLELGVHDKNTLFSHIETCFRVTKMVKYRQKDRIKR